MTKLGRFMMPHLAARIFGTPLAIEPGKLSIILAAIGDRVVGENLEIERNALLPAKGARAEKESIVTVSDGVAMIDVRGTLVHRSSWMDAMSGLQSYEGLSDEFDKAIADPNIKAVLLCIDSPGGEVSGCFEMAERIHASRGRKPVYAIASDTACSAAYLLGSACDKFYATEAAVTGSIGVVVAHVDVSEADKKAGVKVTHVHAGARKVDGNPHEPLSGEAKDTLQALVDKTYAVFVSRVAAYRGISPEAVRATEAAVYVGGDAVKAKIIDGVRSTRAVLAELKSGQRSMLFDSGKAVAALNEYTSAVARATAATTALAAAKQAAANGYASTSTGPYEISGGAGGGGGGGSANFTTTVIGVPDEAGKKRISEWIASIAANETGEASAPEAPKGAAEEEAKQDESDAATAPGTPEPPSRGEEDMEKLAEVQAALEAANKTIADLKVENADLRAQAKGFEQKAKDEIIERHVLAGRVTPAMRDDVKVLAANLSAEDLDARLTKWAQVTRPVGSGSSNATPSLPASANSDSLKALEAKASELRVAHPHLSAPEAFVMACEQNPALYLAHREQHRAANTRR